MEGFKQTQVRCRRGGQHQKVGASGDVRGLGGSLAHGSGSPCGLAFGCIGGPADYGDAGLCRLPREGTTDRAKADYAESRGSHGVEASRAPTTRKRRVLLHQ